MTYGPNNPPTAEEFLDPHRWPPEPDELYDAATQAGVDLASGLGTMWQIPTDPMERIAEALEIIAGGGYTSAQGRNITFYGGKSATETAAEMQRLLTERNDLHEAVGSSDVADLEERAQGRFEELADLEDKYGVLLQVISDVEAALGKSKAGPALAAKAVIEAWKKGPVEVELHEVEPEVEDGQQPTPMNGPLSIEGHTRAETGEDTPDICQECSYAAQDYVVWPCDVAGAVPPAPVVAGEVVVPQQPAHDAPVEEWRAYARALGYAGPEIDKANRSVIRTTLGIAHQNEG